ncbi:hypothetical protein GcM3_068031 [Golovinomyces cichoracearum]|uniref:Uncharacterized protein n=1 Tax=Golovinomyces cichoracearum TaxID=62708 RepID=A0A420ITS6_9PEZI|nr:hypothetical protein GcM3_068031 [Golovinomyces cichoracearum]
METCVTLLNMIGVKLSNGAFMDVDVFSLSRGSITYAAHIYNAELASRTDYLKENGIEIKSHDKYTTLDICRRDVLSSDKLLENLISTGLLTRFVRKSIDDKIIDPCYDDIRRYNDKNKEIGKNFKFATSKLELTKNSCTPRLLATLAARKDIMYSGKYDCWRPSNIPMRNKNWKRLMPIVDADAKLNIDILDEIGNHQVLLEVNGKKEYAMLGRIGGQPVLVRKNHNSLQMVGGVAPHGVRLLSEEKIKLGQPRLMPIPGTLWRHGLIGCPSDHVRSVSV